MNKCKLCGGDLQKIGDGQYRCIYCMHEFSDDDFKVDNRAFIKPQFNEGVNVFEKNINGILEINCEFGNCACAGSGFLISTQGYAITNTHVVSHNRVACSNITVRFAGEIIKAKVIAMGDDNDGYGKGVDLALLKLDRIPLKATPLTCADFNDVKNGERVYVIGNSLGEGTCITSGIVSDRIRVLDGHQLLMTDCPINGGNSGGPIFNSNGDVIGAIVASRIQSDGSATEGMNYAIPIFIINDFIYNRSGVNRMANNKYSKCPRCGSTNFDVKGGIYYCYDCQYEW